MGVFRVNKNKNYTVMSNVHLRDKALPLKAKGLLSLMLSLPEDWDYSMRGLAKLSADGLDSTRAAVKALERSGYVVRRQLYDSRGRFSNNEYTVFEIPQPSSPSSDLPLTGKPSTEKSPSDAPLSEKPSQINTDQVITQERNTLSKNYAQPGDLIFFVGTYDTPGVSHVGIYVGDGVMIHCGDPIQYTSINSSYWQQHFYAFGRPAY